MHTHKKRSDNRALTLFELKAYVETKSLKNQHLKYTIMNDDSLFITKLNNIWQLHKRMNLQYSIYNI